MVTWRTWSVIQDQPVLRSESWWIQPLVSEWAAWHNKKEEEEEETGVSSLFCKWREAPISLLFLPRGAECNELWIQREMPQQQNSSVSRDPAQGSASSWHKMDPNLVHKDWVRPAGGVACPQEWSIPFLFTQWDHASSLLPLSVFSPLLHPHLSASPPPTTTTSLAIHPPSITIMVISVPT